MSGPLLEIALLNENTTRTFRVTTNAPYGSFGMHYSVDVGVWEHYKSLALQGLDESGTRLITSLFALESGIHRPVMRISVYMIAADHLEFELELLTAMTLEPHRREDIVSKLIELFLRPVDWTSEHTAIITDLPVS
jgi:hypothetical protein